MITSGVAILTFHLWFVFYFSCTHQGNNCDQSHTYRPKKLGIGHLDKIFYFGRVSMHLIDQLQLSLHEKYSDKSGLEKLPKAAFEVL